LLTASFHLQVSNWPTFRAFSVCLRVRQVGEALGLLDLFQLLGDAGQKIHVKAGRLVDFESVKLGNTILLGGNQSWSGRIFLYPEGFEFHAEVISNRRPRAGEQTLYKPEFDPVTNSLRRDYALVLMLPNQRRDQRILLITAFTRRARRPPSIT
jgi:hypothetical protein